MSNSHRSKARRRSAETQGYAVSALAIRVVIAVALLLIVPSSHAVQLAPDGIGQVLLFPYYSAQAQESSSTYFYTLFSIVNTTPNVKAVRVRFREGRAGVSVGEFNVYLDAHDVWTFAMDQTSDGRAGIATYDTSCTNPVLPSNHADTPLDASALMNDTSESPNARTLEGYIEVIEMGDYGPPTTTPGTVTYGVSHSGFNEPLDCGVVAKDDGKTAHAPTGGLFGSAMVLSILSNVDYYYAATALAHFSDATAIWALPNANTPSLAQASPAVSVVRDGDGRMITSQWSRGIDAVTALFMANALQGEFVLEPTTASQTNWVITMPTKWYYVHKGLDPSAPFTGSYQARGACEWLQDDYVGHYTRDREGNVQGTGSLGAPTRLNGLCFSAQSAGFNGSDIFTSSHQLQSSSDPSTSPPSAGYIATSYSAGWALVPLDGATTPLQHSMTSGSTTIVNRDATVQTQPSMTYFGLPVMGFAVSTYDNGTLIDSEGRGVFSKFLAGTTLRAPIRVE